MNFTAVVINIIAVAGFLIAFAKDKNKAIRSLKIAGKYPSLNCFLWFL